jgi:hypothetical protein
MTTNTVTTEQALTIGEAVHAKAMGYAHKTGTAIDLTVVTGANAKAEYKLTPSKLLKAINANLTQEEIDGLPLPGSRWNDGGIANNNCDVFQWKDPSKDGDSKPREVSFYVTWADNTPEGVNVCTEIEHCKRTSQKNAKMDDIPAKWLETYSNPKLVDDRLKYLEGRRVTIRSAYKEAVKLIWQMDMVNELTVYEQIDGVATNKIIGGCAATLEDDTGEVLVEDKGAPKKNWKHYSIGAFLRLNPKAALEQGGSYSALKATEKRPVKTPTPKAGTLTLNSIQTPETMDKVGMVFHSYLDKTLATTGSADYALLLKHLTGDAGKQSILTLGGIRDSLNKLFRMDTIQAVYDSEKEKLPKAA